MKEMSCAAVQRERAKVPPCLACLVQQDNIKKTGWRAIEASHMTIFQTGRSRVLAGGLRRRSSDNIHLAHENGLYLIRDRLLPPSPSSFYSVDSRPSLHVPWSRWDFGWAGTGSMVGPGPSDQPSGCSLGMWKSKQDRLWLCPPVVSKSAMIVLSPAALAAIQPCAG
ncbi:hypothetical protein V2G26_003624 [Clonostachys chloroleuca]